MLRAKVAFFVDLYRNKEEVQKRAAQEGFSLLLESSRDGIYGMSADSSCTFLNRAGAQMLGGEVARALRKMPGLERATLVALTGWGAESDRARSSDAGFDHHFTQPAELSTLERLMEKISAGAR